MSGSTVTKSGLPGKNGRDGVTPGASGTAGSSGGSADASINPGTGADNAATATGGVGGAGGSGAQGTTGDGGSGAAGGVGGSVSATTVTVNNSTSGATATASATSGNGGNAGSPGGSDALDGTYGAGANGAAAGNALAKAETTDTDGSATSTATAFGEAGGSGSSGTTAGNGGAGGNASGRATATGLGATASLDVTTGSGGAGGGAGASSGNAGAFTGASVSAVSRNADPASAYLTVNGGNGGYGQFGVTGEGGVGGSAAGGNGTAITLDNAVTGSTEGGTLYLYQSAVGGSGGSSDGGPVGEGGAASSTIKLTDTTSANIATIAEAQGGYGGGASTNGAEGATATAVDDTTAAGSVGTEVVADGGGGGSSDDYISTAGTAAAGATATTKTVAITTGLMTNANAVAETTGGDGGTNNTEGGNAGAAGASVTGSSAEAMGVRGSISAQVDETGGAGGEAQAADGGAAGSASGATARAVASGSGTATASVTAQGGSGGSSNGTGTGAAGGSEFVFNAVSGSTDGGSLSFNQVAVGGAGGGSGGGTAGAGGAATSKLINSDITSALIDAAIIADGGSGGYNSGGTARGGDGGAAVAVLEETASSASGGIQGSVTADGGIGRGSDGGAGSSGGAASAKDDVESSGSGSLYASANAGGGAGGYGDNGMTEGTGGAATAITSAVGANDSSSQTVIALAVATAGGAAEALTPDAAADATASATTADGQLATATATSDGTSGAADATAATAGGIISSLVATASAPAGDKGFATAEADEGSAIASSGNQGAYALAGGLAIFGNLGAKIGTVFNSTKAVKLGTGVLGANYATNATGPASFQSSITWNIKAGSLPSGDSLYLGLVDGTAAGSGFTSLTFEVIEQGSVVLDKTFSSPAQAASYFDDDLINLGSLPAPSDPLSVTVRLSETLAAAGDGYEADVMVGAEQAPHVLTTFKQTQAATTGALKGDFLWSNAANWSAGVPINGDSVKESSLGYDDLASLSLSSLMIDASTTLEVAGTLTVGNLDFATYGTVGTAPGPAGGASVGSLTVDTETGAGGFLQAQGSRSIIDDLATVDPGENYSVSEGGTLLLTATPNAASTFFYVNETPTGLKMDAGTIAFLNPMVTNTETIHGLSGGDVLELPGTSVSEVDLGVSSLTVVTNDGSYSFSNVVYAEPLGGFSAKLDSSTGLEAVTFEASDVFRYTDAVSVTGPAAGDYLWSDTKNWSNGVPVNGQTVVVPSHRSLSGYALDDLAALSLSSLAIDASATLEVAGILPVGNLDFAADGTVGTAPGPAGGASGDSLTVDTETGAGGFLQAQGSRSIIDDLATVDPGENYSVSEGGTLLLTATPNAASTFFYVNENPTGLKMDAGTIAFLNPMVTNTETIHGLSGGDVLELPGTSVSEVDLGVSSLTVVTNDGSYSFSNVVYAEPLGGFSAKVDPATGLAAITFAASDVFRYRHVVAVDGFVDGAYLWSDPANWSNGVPVNGEAVVVPPLGSISGFAVDDLAQLNISSLTIDSGSELDVAGSLTVGAISFAADSSVGTGADPAGGASVGSLTVEAETGAGGGFYAQGAGSVTRDVAAVDPGETYSVIDGGTLLLTATPSAESTFIYENLLPTGVRANAGTIALFNPILTSNETISELSGGDVLELPGTEVTDVVFGIRSLTVTTNDGTYDFANVTYAEPLGGYSAKVDPATGLEAITFEGTDGFRYTDSVAVAGLVDGAYLWSDPANWSNGVPVNDEAVVVPYSHSNYGYALDDLPNLSVPSLTLDSDATLDVAGNLKVGTLSFLSYAVVIAGADLAGGASVGFLTVDAETGASGAFSAQGVGSVIRDLATVDPGEFYTVIDGGALLLTATPNPASSLDYGSLEADVVAGTIALLYPTLTNEETIRGLSGGDVLELPGTSVTGVVFGTTSLTVTTNDGSYDFAKVTYAEPLGGYSAKVDPATGLEAITFEGTDGFRYTDSVSVAGLVDGAYLWSDPANWSNGVPVNGEAVVVPYSHSNYGYALDDLPNLSVPSLTLDSDARLDVAGNLSVGTLSCLSYAVVITGADPAGGASVGSLTVDAETGASGALYAQGIGSVIRNLATVDPGEFYGVIDGGTLLLTATPNPASSLDYESLEADVVAGTIALLNPTLTNDEIIRGLSGGDVLELLGTSVTDVVFGTSSLTVITNDGTYDFAKVTYAEPLGGFSAKVDPATGLEAITFEASDVFRYTDPTLGGGVDFLWSDPANWSNGVPVTGEAVVVPYYDFSYGYALDDLADLSVRTLTLDSDARLDVAANLAAGTISFAPGSFLIMGADPAGGALVISLTVDAETGTGGGLYAQGIGSVIRDLATVDPGEFYGVIGGGTLLLAATPNPSSSLVYARGEADVGGGTIALFDPVVMNADTITGLSIGDVLELPGTEVTDVVFGTRSLTVTTNDGTYTFANVTYDEPLDGYNVELDPATGLEAVTFNATDVFEEKQAATTGSVSGDYLWSNAPNWRDGVPTVGSTVEMAGVGVDDIAGLSLDSLSLSPPPGPAGKQCKLSVEDNLTVNALTVAASSEIDLIGGAESTTLTVTGAATIDGVITTDPSTLTFAGAVTGSGTIDIGAGSGVIFSGPIASTEAVDFLSDTGTLTIADLAQFDAQIIGSGTEVIICYLRGTRVATLAGEVPIETLARGDRLLTRFGRVQPIKWIGRQSFSARFIARNRAQWPVRITAGALGPDQPARDLFVSPGHSMLIEDRLILARNLVNGVTITQSQPTADIHYYQVEFEAQDCILAEGAWSESYADDVGLRNQFHNVAEFRALFPDSRSPSEPELCASRPESGPALASALKPIVARATAGLAPGPLRGFVDSVEPGSITGWAQDMAYPEMPVLLDIWLRDMLLGTILACDHRVDIDQAGIGRGYCGFNFDTPRSISASSLGHVTICRSADGAALQMTPELQALVPDHKNAAKHTVRAPRLQTGPKVVTANAHILSRAAPGPLRGWIDRVEPNRIAGWAQDLTHPELPVLLEIWLHDHLLGTILAGDYREDLEDAGIGRGRHSFSFTIQSDIPTASRLNIAIRRSGDGAALQMTSELQANLTRECSVSRRDGHDDVESFHRRSARH